MILVIEASCFYIMKTINRFLYSSIFLGFVCFASHALAAVSSNGHQVVTGFGKLDHMRVSL